MIPALIAAIPALIQLGTSIAQKAKANKIEKGNQRSNLNVPDYQIPPEVAQYVAGLKGQALDPRLAGQSAIEDQLSGNTERAAQRMTNTGAPLTDILNTISSTAGSEGDTRLNLGVNAAQDYRQRQLEATKGVLTMADAKNRAYDINRENYLKDFSYNKDEPYKEKAAAASALRFGAGQNSYGAAQDLSSIGVLASMNPGMFGGKGSAGGSATGDTDIMKVLNEIMKRGAGGTAPSNPGNSYSLQQLDNLQTT